MFYLAANQGNPDAQYLLSKEYAQIKLPYKSSVKQNYEEAIRLYNLSISQGTACASNFV
jgi:TPR repeat protein